MTGMSAAEMAASAEKELGAIEEAVGTKFTAAMEKLKLAIAPIGEMFTKLAIPVINFLSKIADAFNNLPDFAKKFIGLATVIVGLVIPAGTMFLGLLVNLVGTLTKFGAVTGSAFRGFLSGGIKGAFDAVSQSVNYMSLEQIDAATASQQLAGSTEAVNAALLGQVGASEGAQAAVMELAYAYEILTQQMREAAAMNEVVFGTSAAAMGAAGTRGPRVRRNRGGTIPGSGNTDTVPAMLTPGEFVINKQATQDNLPLLRAINSGAKIPRFSNGSKNAVEEAHQLGLGDRPLIPGTSQNYERNPSPTNFDGDDFIPSSSAAQRVAARTSRKYYSQLLEEKGDTKNVAALRYAVEELGISPSDLRLTGRSTYGFLLSRDANKLMMERTLSRDILTQELSNRGSLHPIRKQLQDYLEHQLDDQEFIKILNEELDRTSIRGGVQGPITNQNFEQASGRALNRYLSEKTQVDAATRRNFLRAIFAKKEISANLAVSLLEEKLANAGIPRVDKPNRRTPLPYYTGKGKKIKVRTSGGTISAGRLTGQEIGTLAKDITIPSKNITIPPKIMNIPRFRAFKLRGFMQRGMPTVFAHGRNAGGPIPGTGNSDTVPAMLTPGEFVINKKATQSNRALLEAINNGQIKGYAFGGLVLEGQDVDGRDIYRTSTGKLVYGNNRPVPENRIPQTRGQRIKTRMSGAMGGGRGMGMGMGLGMLGGAMFMGSSMMPNQGASTAMQIGGTALSIGSMLPMMGGLGGMLAPLAGIAAPAAAVAAGLAVAGIAAYKWRDSVDSAARKAAEFGSNLGGTANAFNQIASLMGTQTPAQRQAALQIGFTTGEQAAVAEEFQNIFGSEQGQAFIKDLEESTSEERFKKLSDYLRAGIASGIMDKEMATGLAKAVSLTIGDTILGARTVGAISEQESGAAAVADMAQARADSVSSLKEFTRVVQEEGRILDQADAAKIIGGSIQTIQDFSNASALAREQLANGEITQEQYNKIIQQSESQQALFTKAIEESLMHTTDFGGTMQGTLDQLTKAGLATEEGLNKLREAAEAASFSNVVGEAGTQQNLMAAGVSAVAAGMDEVIAAEAIQRIGQDERIQQTFANLSRSGVGGGQALAGSEFVGQILSGQMFGTTMQGQQLGVTAARAEQFAGRGGDIIGAQSYLLSQPLEQRAGVAQSFFALSDDDKNTLVKDYQDLAQLAGSEFARELVDSADYKKALEEGTTEDFTKDIKRASAIFGEETQSIREYAQKTGRSLNDLSSSAEKLSMLPQELAFRLGIDITNIADLDEYGPMADQLKQSWPILSQLPPEIDLKAFIETNTLENGQLAPIDKIADGVVKVTKAYAQLGSQEPEIVKKAAIEIMTAQGATLEAAESTFKTLIDNMEDFNNFTLESKYALITLQTAIDEVGLQMSLVQQAVADGDMTADTGLRQIQSLSGKRAALQGQLDVAEVQAQITARAPASSRGGGGQKEKTIPEMLKEEMKLATGFANQFGRNKIGKIMGKPFGSEFLEFIKSQGEKGLKFIKGNFKKFKDAYKTFEKTQKTLSLQTLQFMPGKLAEELQGRKDNLALVKMIAQEEGMSLQTAIETVGVLDSLQQKEYLRLVAKKKLTDQEKEHLALLKQSMGIAKETALFDEKNAEVMKFMNMSAEERESARISNLMDIQNINRQIEEINVLEPLQKQLDAQQKILDAEQRTIDLKQREIDSIGRAIELKQREIEPIDDQIEKLEEQKTKVEESYDTQLKALDDIARKEDNLARIREGRLDVASALSRGDVGAAAQAAIEMQRRFAEGQQEAARTALEARRQQEIDVIQGDIKQKQEERAAIEEQIRDLELDQRKIQDEIYVIQQNMIPVQDEIFRIQSDIATKTDELNSKYDDTNLRLQSLNGQLRDALATQNAINTAAADENRIRREKAEQAATISVQPAGPTIEELANKVVSGTATQAETDTWFDQLMANVNAQYRQLGGKVTKYAMGGKVNYRGSREPAPGMMYGGKMKKYAMGSFVPGRGMTDKVPAMLTPGEFVVRKSVASQYGPLLQAMNGDIFPGMRGIANDPVFYAPSVNASSLIAPISNLTAPMDNRSMQYNYSINVNAKTDADANEIANVVINKIKRIDDRQVKGVRL
jgi:hypothetical protein